MGFVKQLAKELYGRVVKRKMQEFNIENRAYKLMDQDKMPPSPRHFTEEQALQKFLAANPHLKEEVYKKYQGLVDNMGRLKINVQYPPEMKTKRKSKLPKDRQIIPKDMNFRVHKVPTGCIDFEMFLRIYDYKFNHLWSNEEIAEEFDLDERHVDDLLFYFKPFNNRVMDKKKYTTYEEFMQDKTYVKMANMLGRDVETFKRIPEYKQELAKIEQENKAAELYEHADEINEETEEEANERIESLKFKHEIFFLREKAEAEEENAGESPDGEQETQSSATTERTSGPNARSASELKAAGASGSKAEGARDPKTAGDLKGNLKSEAKKATRSESQSDAKVKSDAKSGTKVKQTKKAKSSAKSEDANSPQDSSDKKDADSKR